MVQESRQGKKRTVVLRKVFLQDDGGWEKLAVSDEEVRQKNNGKESIKKIHPQSARSRSDQQTRFVNEWECGVEQMRMRRKTNFVAIKKYLFQEQTHNFSIKKMLMAAH